MCFFNVYYTEEILLRVDFLKWLVKMTLLYDNFPIENYFRRCIQLAKQTPKDIPPPQVGSLVISGIDGKVVGEGFKQKPKGLNLVIHAERVALNEAGHLAEGGCLITTFEPCFIGKRREPPISSCCRLIVGYGIKVAIIGYSPKDYAGFGIRFLTENGVTVIKYTELNDEISRELNLKRVLFK